MLTFDQARARLARMLQGEPALKGSEIDDLMTIAIDEPDAKAWAASTGFGRFTRIQPSIPNGRAYMATNDGTSGSVEPTWPTVAGSTVVDGTITWQAVAGDYELNRAAAEGWGWKAAKAANNISLGAGGASLQKNQIYEHCRDMQFMYQQRQPVGVLTMTRSDVIG